MSTTGVKSPKSPRNTLKDSLEVTQKLFKEASRAFVSRETAAKAMGYSGLTGSSLTFLASLVGYGLLAKKGAEVKVSDLAIEILHPTNDDQKKQALKKAALNPPLFADLAQNHGDCSEAVLASKLIQDKFPPEGAKKTARVFIANKEFANVDGPDYSGLDQNESSSDETSTTPLSDMIATQPVTKTPSLGAAISSLIQSSVLPVPVAGRIASIPFPMTEEDFNLFIATLNLWKPNIVVKKDDANK
jgi:hypothetical protein